MPDSNVAVRFTRSVPPYEAGDVAGFAPARAEELIGRGLADPVDLGSTTAPDAFAAMDRATLLAYAREHLGMTDEPPADVTDETLREAIRQHAAAAGATTETPTSPVQGGSGKSKGKTPS